MIDTHPAIRQSHDMNPAAVAKEIKRRTPVPPKPRATKGRWVEPAWAVRILVEREGWDVSAAVRQVIKTLNLHPPEQAFPGIRAAYYVVAKQPWPEKLKA